MKQFEESIPITRQYRADLPEEIKTGKEKRRANRRGKKRRIKNKKL